MKKLILLIPIALTIFGCGKKTIKPTPTVTNKLQIAVSGLTNKTSVTLLLRNENFDTLLSVVNHFKDTTYTVTTVSPGQNVLFHYNSNMPADAVTNDGIGNIKLTFNGQQVENYGGSLNGTLGATYNIQMPAAN